MRTVEVLQFCSWSALKRKNRSSASHHVLVQDVILDRRGEHHVHEILHELQLVGGVHHRLPDGLLVGEGRDGADLAHDIGDDDFLGGRVQVVPDRVEGRKGGRHAGEDGHGVGAIGVSGEEMQHVLVDEGGFVEPLGKVQELGLAGKVRRT